MLVVTSLTRASSVFSNVLTYAIPIYFLGEGGGGWKRKSRQTAVTLSRVSREEYDDHLAATRIAH